MKKTISLSLFVLLLSLAACGKSSSGNSNTNPNNGYNQPQFAPPNNNWDNYSYGQVPQGNCGQHQQLPTDCYGTYNGYNYCGNQWYYYWSNSYWSFPSCGSCGCSYTPPPVVVPPVVIPPCGSSCDHDDDDDHHPPVDTSYDSGWKKVWGIMGDSENTYVTVTVPKTGKYYLSFKGAYTGKSQGDEKLEIEFYGGNWHDIDDLNQSYTGSGEVTQSCKVNVIYNLTAGLIYKIYLKGDQDSVNNTYVRVTNFVPSSISKYCD